LSLVLCSIIYSAVLLGGLFGMYVIAAFDGNKWRPIIVRTHCSI